MSKIKRIVTKFLLSFFVFLVLIFSIVPAAHAQQSGTWYDQSFPEWSQKVFDTSNPQDIFGERYTYAQVNWIVNSITSMVITGKLMSCYQLINNTDIQNFQNCVENFAGTASAGAAGSLASIGDSLLTNHLASGIKYTGQTLANLHLVSPAYAQGGFGFQTLEPVQTVWRATRNITYLLMVLVAIALSFMIMFRIKISPQVVISVQSAIPKLAIALILITFSYAIAGFVIDISYLILGVVAMAVKTVGNDISTLGTVELFRQLLYAHPLGALFLTFGLFILGAFVAAAVVGGAITVATGGAVLPAIGGMGLVSVLILVIIGVLLLIISFRILWLMIKTAITILLLIMGGPLIILWGAISPTAGFGTWFRGLISNVMVFPVIIVMLFLSHYFFWGFFSSQDPIGGLLARWSWVNPYQINAATIAGRQVGLSFPGFGGTSLSTLGFLLSLGILFLVPSVGNMIQSLLQGKPFDYGTAIGESTKGMYERFSRLGPVAAVKEYYSRETGAKVMKLGSEAFKATGTEVGETIGKSLKAASEGVRKPPR